MVSPTPPLPGPGPGAGSQNTVMSRRSSSSPPLVPITKSAVKPRSVGVFRAVAAAARSRPDSGGG